MREVLTELAYGRQCDTLEELLQLRDLLKVRGEDFSVPTQVEKERGALPAAFDAHGLERHASKQVPDCGADSDSMTVRELYLEYLTNVVELREKG